MRPVIRFSFLTLALAAVFAVVGSPVSSAAAAAPDATNVLDGQVEAARNGRDVTLQFEGFGAGPRHVVVTFLEDKDTVVLRDEFDQVVAPGPAGSDTFTKTYRLPDGSEAEGFAIVTGPEAPQVLGASFERSARSESRAGLPWGAGLAALAALIGVGAWMRNRRSATSST